ncbi:glycosyltransferase [Bariatricus sp. HCP28S3_A7]|uniref:glycosyltransferase n=1 Tax=Bariatricus sp. HCP28S3_A7 TaxID=3438894 RepID=UPI003F88E711
MDEKVIFQVLPAFRLGGAEIMAENLAIEQQKRGYMVYAVSFFRYESAITERLEKQGVPVIYLDKKEGADIQSVRKFRQLIDKYHPAFIHTHLYILEYVLLAAVGKKVRIVHTVHNVAEKEVSASRRKLRQLIYKLKKVTPVSISPRVQDSMCSVYRLSKKQTPMVYNGIDLKKCVVKDANVLQDPFKILNIGRLEEQKNQHTIIEAVATLPKEVNVEVTIVGEGSRKEMLEQLIKDKNETRVRLSGAKSTVYQLMHENDAFWLSSAWEGMPITLIEAMGTGMSILTTNVGGIPDMVDHTSAIIVAPDLDSQQKGLAKLLSMTNEQHVNMRRNARKGANRFSVEIMCDQYLKIYDRC